MDVDRNDILGTFISQPLNKAVPHLPVGPRYEDARFANVIGHMNDSMMKRAVTSLYVHLYAGTPCHDEVTTVMMHAGDDGTRIGMVTRRALRPNSRNDNKPDAIARIVTRPWLVVAFNDFVFTE
jgi:hypothetical protein